MKFQSRNKRRQGGEKDEGRTDGERCDDQQRTLNARSRSEDEDEGLNPQITTYMIRIGPSDVFTAFRASFIVAGREKTSWRKI